VLQRDHVRMARDDQDRRLQRSHLRLPRHRLVLECDQPGDQSGKPLGIRRQTPVLLRERQLDKHLDSHLRDEIPERRLPHFDIEARRRCDEFPHLQRIRIASCSPAAAPIE
jgi:hypothetical protein